MVLGWALQLGRKGHGVPWFDFKKQSPLTSWAEKGSVKMS